MSLSAERLERATPVTDSPARVAEKDQAVRVGGTSQAVTRRERQPALDLAQRESASALD